MTETLDKDFVVYGEDPANFIELGKVTINEDHQLRVMLMTGGSRPVINLREFRQRAPGDWRPQNQAVFVGARFLPDLIRILLKGHQITTGQRPAK